MNSKNKLNNKKTIFYTNIKRKLNIDQIISNHLPKEWKRI